jgi:Na+/proline symporter
MRCGFAAGSVMVFTLMMFFGIMGMIAYANDPEAYDNGTKYTYLSFFDLLEPLSGVWHIVTLILVTALTTSTVDTLQNALLSTLSSDVIKSSNAKWISRIIVVAINVPAIVLSAKRYDVLSLFLVADLVCATSVLPLMLGFMTKDQLNGWIRAPTELGAFLGCISGVCTVLVIGRVVDAPGGLFHYFWLPNGDICTLCGSKTMYTFIFTILSGGVFALLFSFFDILIRGESARLPLWSKKRVEDVIESDIEISEEAKKDDVEAGDNQEVTFKDFKTTEETAN